MPEDRPDEETLANDERFDNWMIAFERKMSQKSSTHHPVQMNGQSANNESATPARQRAKGD